MYTIAITYILTHPTTEFISQQAFQSVRNHRKWLGNDNFAFVTPTVSNRYL